MSIPLAAPSVRAAASTAAPRGRGAPMSAATPGRHAAWQVPHRGLITLCVMGASIMQALDHPSPNVALRAHSGSCRVHRNKVLGAAFVHRRHRIHDPLTGWLAGEPWAAARVRASVLGFTIARPLCGVAESLPHRARAAALQGVCGSRADSDVAGGDAGIQPARAPRARDEPVGDGLTVGPFIGPALGAG